MEIWEKVKRLKEDNAHIPTPEVLEDLKVTEEEVEDLERKVRGYMQLGDRMSLFRAESLRNGIEQRRAFIKKLQLLLKARERDASKK